MNSKLLLVEGLPSTGKTTIAQIIKSILDEENINNEIYLEGNLDHPADYDRVAYFSKEEYIYFLEGNRKYQDLIEKITEAKEEGYFIRYSKQKKKLADKFPDELFKKIYQRDIYELPLELNKKLILNKWQRFADKAKKEDKVYIFECVFIQNPITVSIISENEPKEYAFNYVMDLLNIVEELNPKLFYLQQDNIEESFQKVINERPEWWLDFFIDYYNKREFGKANNFQGLEGTFKGLKKIDEIQLELFHKLNMEKYIINNSHYDEDKIKSKLKNLLLKINDK